MVPAATTVGGYLQSLPNDRRVAMARVCSMIRRSARGVRESMRFGLAFYELDGPLFAVESHEKSLVLYLAERDVVKDFKDKIKNIDIALNFPILTAFRSTSSKSLSAPPLSAGAPARPAPKSRRPKLISSPSGA